MSVSLPLVLGLALSGVAHAQDTIDLGVLKNSDISVVQKMLYTKEGRTELAMHVGVMPFDAYSTTPLAMVSYGSFMSESLGWEVALGAGYGLKTADYKELEGPMYGVAPDAYRYLGASIEAFPSGGRRAVVADLREAEPGWAEDPAL